MFLPLHLGVHDDHVFKLLTNNRLIVRNCFSFDRIFTINFKSKRHGAGHLGATDSAPTVQAPGLYGAGIILLPPFRRQSFRHKLFAIVEKEWVRRADHAKRHHGKTFVAKKAIKTKCAHQLYNTMIMYDKVYYTLSLS